ncbi:hypothetical protein RCO48_04460 [Peribacillus frigoritolerans]|nr:hypothetical protein [Peribacillus frigoritolerans]
MIVLMNLIFLYLMESIFGVNLCLGECSTKMKNQKKRRQAANSRWEKARKEQENSEKKCYWYANALQRRCKCNARKGK